MNTILLRISFLFLVFFNTSSFADKTIINGSAVTLQASTDYDNTYTLPGDYTVKPINYVVLDGTQRLCFGETQVAFVDLGVQVITVNVGNKTLGTWYCYENNPNYFKINP